MKGSIPRQFIDDLLTKSNIVDVINARVKLKKRDEIIKLAVRFITKKTPSFTVSEKKQFYYCFGCGAKGNAISFLMDYDKLEFVEAVEELAASAGLEVPYEKRPNQFGNKPDVSYQTKRNLYDLMQEIALFLSSATPAKYSCSKLSSATWFIARNYCSFSNWLCTQCDGYGVASIR